MSKKNIIHRVEDVAVLFPIGSPNRKTLYSAVDVIIQIRRELKSLKAEKANDNQTSTIG
jgi:hypothetical protein